jgi:hypothetical protein
MIGIHRDYEYSVGKNIQYNIKEMKKKYLEIKDNEDYTLLKYTMTLIDTELPYSYLEEIIILKSEEHIKYCNLNHETILILMKIGKNKGFKNSIFLIRKWLSSCGKF